MCRVGFIDDDVSLLKEYTNQFRRRNIELYFVRDCSTFEEIYNWIMNNRIECFLVDYQLLGKYDFTGTDLMSEMNLYIPYLPCIILTNYIEDSKNENLVIRNLIVDRDIIVSENKEDFFQSIKHACAVFRHKLKIIAAEYQKLKKKLGENIITFDETERLKLLQNQLSAYGVVDEVPRAMIDHEMKDKLDSLLRDLKKVIENMDDETI